MHRSKPCIITLLLFLVLFALHGTALAYTGAEAADPPVLGTVSAEDTADTALPPDTLTAADPDAAQTDTPPAGDEVQAEEPSPAEDVPADAEASPEETAPAATGFDAFPDAAGHWAAESLRWAYDHGILQGFQDGSLRPDAPVNRAEALTILTRLLQAQAQSEAALPLPAGKWFSDALRKGAYLGLIAENSAQDMEAPLLRLDLFLMLNSAFRLRGGSETADLSAYSDLQFCSDWEKQEIGFLLEQGYIQGYENKLKPYAGLTRAELVILLQRIVPQLGADADSLPEAGAALLSGAVDLSGKRIQAPLFLDCQSSALTLHNTQAQRLTLLSQQLEALELGGNTQIAQLTVGGGQGEALQISTKGAAIVETLVIDSHRGEVLVSGKVKTLILRGAGQVTVQAQGLETLLLFGSGEVVLNSRVPELLVYGGASRLSGSGSIGKLTHHRGSYELLSTQLGPAELAEQTDPGIEGLTLTGSAPEWLPIGEPLLFRIQASNPVPRALTIDWYLGADKVHSETGTVTPEGSSFQFTYPVPYKRAMETKRELRCVLTYRDFFGSQSSAELRKSVTLENHPNAYYDQAALSLVTTGYQGNYTLEWAQQHDYEESVKTAWVNAKGYSSPTEYLIWISLSHQRVNIFQGNAGDWTLIRSCLMGSGRSGHDTPAGFYSVTARSAKGWTTSSYNVHPVTNFTNARYTQMAFHSRKYNPALTKMIDPRIGFPISDGCIRMYDDDAWWIFGNIPHRTAVVVY